VREREREREILHLGWRGQKHFTALKVPRQCPLVLLVGVGLRKGKALGSEKGKMLGCGLSCDQRKEVEPDFTEHGR
jgi:hypothetical protein